MVVKAKIFINKKNNQIIIFPSRKQLPFLKDRMPKFLNIKMEDFEF